MPDFTLAAMRLELAQGGKPKNLEAIFEFMNSNYEIDGNGVCNGWIIKSPFKTHTSQGNCKRSFRTTDEILRVF